MTTNGPRLKVLRSFKVVDTGGAMAARRYGTVAQKGSVHVIYDVAEYVEITWIPNAGEEHGLTRQRSHSLYVVDDVGVSINYHDLKMLEQKGYLELRLE